MSEIKQKPITSLERQRDEWKQIAENNRRMFDEKEQELLKTQQENAALVEALDCALRVMRHMNPNVETLWRSDCDIIKSALRAAGEEEGV